MSHDTHPAANKTIIASRSTTWSKQDTIWMLGLYGTAIGAGTLFLPINAGMNGIIHLLIMVIIAFPMTYFPHRALCRFVLSSTCPQANLTTIADEYFGAFTGKILTGLYFLSIYPVLLMYSVAITNTTQSFIVNQLGWPSPPRALLAITLILALMSIIRFGQKAIIRSMSILVYPFITALMALAIYLIPYWNNAVFAQDLIEHSQNGYTLLKSIWLLIPVMIFSFNHSAIISSFAINQKAQYGDEADNQSQRLLKYTHCLMVGTVMFFVLSCVFSLSPQDLALAKQQNISILSYLANHFKTPAIAFVAPFIAFIAISKSFLGHYLGAREGMHSLLVTATNNSKRIKAAHLDPLIEIAIVSSCWLVATLNPSILKMIEVLSGPIIAIILFLMPMYAIAKVPSMKKYRHPIVDRFVVIIGLIAISAIVYGILD